jgi:hypothetical protein
MNLDTLTPPAAGSYAAHLLLDRQAGDIEAELGRLLASDPPAEVEIVLRGWWGGGYRFCLLTEGEEFIAGRLIEDPDDLAMSVLETLAGSEASGWNIHAAPGVQDRITALLLSCSKQEGALQ